MADNQVNYSRVKGVCECFVLGRGASHDCHVTGFFFFQCCVGSRKMTMTGPVQSGSRRNGRR